MEVRESFEFEVLIYLL